MASRTVKASQIIGTQVANWEGEHLGLIVEVMIDKLHGDVAYLVMSYPGTFGPDYLNKYFAVPFESVAMKHLVEDVEYILNIDEAFLRRAPGFDKIDWPDFADTRFTSVLRDFYKDVKIDVMA